MKKIIKYKPLIIGIFPILIIFLCGWYSNYFSLSFVLGPVIFCIIIIFSYLGTLFLLANSLNEFIKTRNNVYVMTFVLLLFFLMFLFAKLALRKYPKIAACEVLTITSIVFSS